MKNPQKQKPISKNPKEKLKTKQIEGFSKDSSTILNRTKIALSVNQTKLCQKIVKRKESKQG